GQPITVDVRFRNAAVSEGEAKVAGTLSPSRGRKHKGRCGPEGDRHEREAQYAVVHVFSPPARLVERSVGTVTGGIAAIVTSFWNRNRVPRMRVTPSCAGWTTSGTSPPCRARIRRPHPPVPTRIAGRARARFHVDASAQRGAL